jgi:hypothetical protein
MKRTPCRVRDLVVVLLFAFTATLLQDDRVLVTGGSAITGDHVVPGVDTGSPSAELYTP